MTPSAQKPALASGKLTFKMTKSPSDDPKTEEEFNEVLFEEAHGFDVQALPEAQEVRADAKRPKVHEAEKGEMSSVRSLKHKKGK